ncbi:hypothetical protein GOP47_0002862 [Adiantum capillus-veneris]|uniref:Cytochrome P450 n=1 Tax=Adiantum capillus-veneris TaxID=13818 RepID=A0A9D4VBP0_ADICA|nr:hypothetical protein GOP47_0002862 [Adiantum capillus-veneris]
MAVLPASNPVLLMIIPDDHISLLVGLLLLACSLLFVCKRQITCLWRPTSTPLPPGSFGFPWLGETLEFNRALVANHLDASFLHRRTTKLSSKTFKTHILMRPTAILQGASANRFLAAGEKQNLIRNSWAPSVLRVVGAHAPPAKHGPAHRRLRHILSSCLCPLALQKLVGKADIITQKHFASCWRGQSELSLFPLLKLHTFRVACSLLASIDDEAIVTRMYPLFNTWLVGMMAVPINLPGTTYYKSLQARKALIRELSDIIPRRQQELGLKEQNSEADECAGDMDGEQNVSSASTGRDDLLSMLLKAQDENGGFLEEEELQDLLLFILFAGHDTTTATLAAALKLLEANPTSCDTLSQEHETIFFQKKDGKEVLGWEDIQKMKYTWMVIQESMRLMPPVFGGLKEAMQDLNFDGYQIPKGWKMFYSTTITHHDEKYFSEPTKFDPARFDQTKKKDGTFLTPFAYIPFGIGPHSCPGNEFARMTTCIFLYHLVRHFKWMSKDPHESFSVFPMPKLTKGYLATILERTS